MRLSDKIIAAGALFKCSKTNRCFYLLRSEKTSYSGRWGLVGGKIKKDESIIAGLCREIGEEIGFIPIIEKWIYFSQYTSPDKKLYYHSILCLTPNEFVPTLNAESCGFSWVPINIKIGPMHPGLKNVFSSDLLIQSLRDFR